MAAAESSVVLWTGKKPLLGPAESLTLSWAPSATPKALDFNITMTLSLKSPKWWVGGQGWWVGG